MELAYQPLDSPAINDHPTDSVTRYAPKEEILPKNRAWIKTFESAKHVRINKFLLILSNQDVQMNRFNTNSVEKTTFPVVGSLHRYNKNW